MTTLAEFEGLAAADHGLCVVVTTRADGSAQASVVNAGVTQHPVTHEPVVALVARGTTRKLANLRARPRMTIVARNGWQWAAVEGTTKIIGPDDPGDFSADAIRVLLREVFIAAGGTHDDWDEYDRVMLEDRRAAVFVTPERVYSNG
ncbi:MAG TPA: pyridoxamine 5'-phosphate oxidase family protein [Acidimicrobiia bacterium]|jgi:PPOX class probable F420-dependent enzyme|nr:pyridoxamine 5'-phosphate oxidase family protein [Acidimicrobiia bacterium]